MARMKPALSSVFVATTVAVAAHVAPPLRAAEDLAALEKRGAIRAIVAADESPETYALAAGGEPGFERELLEGFARLRGLKLETVVSKTYPDRIPALVGGRGDVIIAIFDTPDRRKQVGFTQEILPTHNVAVTLKPAAVLASVKDLPAQRVGAIKGTKPSEAAIEAGVPAASLRTYERLDDMCDALQRGEITAAVLPISELALARKRYPGLQAGATVGDPGAIAWAVRKDDEDLKRALDEYLANLRRSASWSRLVVKYFGDEALKVLGRERP
jgi:ABC-type amino acid transport substrate-binding protein